MLSKITAIYVTQIKQFMQEKLVNMEKAKKKKKEEEEVATE